MTIAEALAIPKGMDFEEYGKLLEKRKRIEKKISRLSDEIQDEEDSLEVLEDEKGSEIYNKHLQAKKDAEAKRKKACEQYEEIKKKLKGE